MLHGDTATTDRRYALLQVHDALQHDKWKTAIEEIISSTNKDISNSEYDELILEVERIKAASGLELFEQLAVVKPDANISMHGLNLEEYKKLLLTLTVGAYIEDSGDVSNNAYKLVLMMGDAAQALNYVREYQKFHRDSKRPIHDSCIFNLPENDKWDANVWQMFCRKYLINDSFRNGFAIPNAGQIPLREILEKLQVKLTNIPNSNTKTGAAVLYELNQVKIQIQYPRWKEDPEAAEIFAQCRATGKYIPASVFNTYLDKVKPFIKNSDEYIPPVFIDGNDIGCPGYYVAKLSAEDPKAAVLGYLTACCQSLGGAGEKCAIHGITNETSGFYVICKGKIPNQEARENTGRGISPKDIVAQSWAWIDKKDDNKTIVLDSLERLPAIPLQTLAKLTSALAEALGGSKGVDQVHIGTSGNTPASLLFQEAKSVVPLEYNNYRDSEYQCELFSKERPLLGKFVKQTSEAITEYLALDEKGRSVYDQKTLSKLVAAFGSETDIIRYAELTTNNNPEARMKLLTDMFYMSLKMGQEKNTAFYLGQGLNPNYKDENRKSLLSFSAENNLLETMKLLIERGVDISSKDYSRRSALHYACANNAGKSVEYLIEQKSLKINDADFHGNTPLHYAVMAESEGVVSQLAEAGADACVNNKENESPLYLACERENADMVRALLAAPGFNIGKVATSSSDSPIIEAIAKNSLEIVMLFAEHGLDLNKVNYYGESALHMACRQGNLELAKFMLEKGADLKANQDGSPLHVACSSGNLSIVELLISHGGDINLLNSKNETPLDQALKNGQAGVANYLIQHGAKTGPDFASTLASAAGEGHFEAVKIMLSMPVSETPLQEALLSTCAGYNEIQKHLAGHSTIKFIMKDNDTMRMQAKGCEAIMSELAGRVGNMGEIMLGCVKKGNVEALQVLLAIPQGKAQVNFADEDGVTLLMHAGGENKSYSDQKIQLVKLFIEHGADVNATDNHGNKVFDHACISCEKEIFECLALKGAVVSQEMFLNYYQSPFILDPMLACRYDASVNLSEVADKYCEFIRSLRSNHIGNITEIQSIVNKLEQQGAKPSENNKIYLECSSLIKNLQPSIRENILNKFHDHQLTSKSLPSSIDVEKLVTALKACLPLQEYQKLLQETPSLLEIFKISDRAYSQHIAAPKVSTHHSGMFAHNEGQKVSVDNANVDLPKNRKSQG